MEDNLLARLQYQPDALTHLLKELTEPQIRQRLEPDKWSIFENIAHLGRYQEVFRNRITVILQEEKPGFERYVADQDAGFPDWLAQPFDKLSRDFHHSRNTLREAIAHLSEDQCQRVGFHPVYGAMSVTGWTEFFLLHEAHHFLTILKLAGQLRRPDQVMG